MQMDIYKFPGALPGNLRELSYVEVRALQNLRGHKD